MNAVIVAAKTIGQWVYAYMYEDEKKRNKNNCLRVNRKEYLYNLPLMCGLV